MQRHQVVNNRNEGAHFEKILEIRATIQGLLFIKMPLGARRIPSRSGRPNLLPVKTPFDYVLVNQGKSVFIDCKTFDCSRITYSMLTQHQIFTLNNIQNNGCRAGYLVNHRDVDKVIFYEATKLSKIEPRGSIESSEGSDLGNGHSFDLKKLFDYGCTGVPALGPT